MTKRMLIVLLALGLVLGAMFGWKYYVGQQMALFASMPPPPASVAAAEVQSESWQPYLTAVGSLVASQGISVTTEVAGKVSEILFESGQQVEAGTLLLQLDESVDRAELTGIVAERRLAEQQYKRRKDLATDYAARTMYWSGPILLLFVVFVVTAAVYEHAIRDAHIDHRLHSIWAAARSASADDIAECTP